MEGAGGCTFAGRSLYEYVHPDEGARRHPGGEEPWTTPTLLAERGRPWPGADVPDATQPRAKRKPHKG